MKRHDILRFTAFLLLAAALILGASAVFARKASCRYAEKVNGFFNERPDSMELLCFGSSRMYCTMNPLVLYHETGLNSYVLSTQQQPLAASYYYMRESLKTQSPQVLLLEATMAFTDPADTPEGALRDCLDPLPWSENKRAIIRALVPEGKRSSYYFPFLKYHQRWKELSAQDFDFSWRERRDPLRGCFAMDFARPEHCRQQSYTDVEAAAIPAENLSLLREMKALAEEHGAQLVLMAAPYEAVTEDLGCLKTLHAFCETEQIPFLDLNLVYDSIGLDGEQDFIDEGHFNLSGSVKATRRIGSFLLDLGMAPQGNAPDEELRQNYALLIKPIVQRIEAGA